MSELMKKHEMTEEDIKLQFITPAIEAAGWDKFKQIKLEYNFTDGRVIVRGNVTARGKRKRTDYLLYYKPNLPLAIVEAKDNKHSLGAGMQQGIEYAEVLDVPFVYSSNGDGFLEHDMKTGAEKELSLDQFPSPDELWHRYMGDEQITPEQEELITEPYYFQPGDKTPRYYQRIAINRTVDAVARGQNRILLVMATGTGKTYTAFQIIHRLWKSGRKKKILFLADRNILVDQTMQQDFKPFLVSYTISDRPVLGMITSMLENAFETIPDGTGLILHSDQGWQYQHKKYQHMLRRKGVRQSMSRKGNCLDNAVMENFFGLLKSELLYLQKFDSLEHFKQELVDYLDYYNNRRIKIKLKGLPPALHRQQALSVA